MHDGADAPFSRGGVRGCTLATLSDAAGAIILVVDDEADVRRLTTIGLQQRGYRTVEAADGDEALQRIADCEIDLMLLDSSLPRLDGMAVLTRVRGTPHLATLPVIMVTGRAGLDDKVHALSAGANDYLAKPVALDELAARIEANLRGERIWVDRMTQRLHERSLLAAQLASHPTASFLDVAHQVVDTFAALPRAATAAIIEVSGHGHAIVVADNDRHGASRLIAGSRLAPSITSELLRLSAVGASVLNDGAGAGFRGPETGTLVGATIGSSGSGVYALVVEVDSSAPDQRAAVREMLGLAMELAPMIESALSSRARDDTLADLAQSIAQIVERREFFPVYQPICDVSDDRPKVVGYEALTRFRDGVSPASRFADATLAGVADVLELGTLRVALEGAAALPADAYISVNVSATLLAHGDLPTVLLAAGDRPVCIELTEHEQIDDYDQLRRAFGTLGDGVRLSVDDAGSGWASLRHVFTLRPDFVKLDRSWVADIHTDPARQALLLGIGRFVTELGGSVVAEGVEQATELDTLRGIGLHFAQGYLLGRPAPAEAQLHG